jgi:hypothetical protein
MNNLTDYWNIPASEQQTVTDDVKQQAKAQEPGQIPTQVTLVNALNTSENGMEFAVCASMLFIIIVQDREDLGGGYGVTVTALGQIHTERFQTDLIESVEAWLAENTPYTTGSSVWVPLPVYNSHENETEYLDKLW